MSQSVGASLSTGREENPEVLPAQKVGGGLKPTTLARRARSGRLPERWSEVDDKALRATKGRWSRIEAMAARCGVETRVLTARWHRLRVAKRPLPTPGAGPVKPVEFDALVRGVTPRMAVILRCIKCLGQAGYDDLCDELDGVDALIVRRCIERNVARLERMGWRLRRDVVANRAMFSLVRL